MAPRATEGSLRRGAAALLCVAAAACSGGGADEARRPAPAAGAPATPAPAARAGGCPGGEEELLDAAFRGDRDRVAACLGGGAWIDAVDSSGASALDHAALRGHADLVRLLLERGARIVQDSERNPLGAAAREGHARVVDLLLAAGADPSASWLDKPALLHAIDRQRTEIALDLIDAGASVHGRDRAGRSALAAAVDAGNRALVDALLAGGADPTESCPGGSPLERAEERPDLASLTRRLRAAAAADLAGRRSESSAYEPVDVGGEDEDLREEESSEQSDEETPPDLEWPPPPRGLFR